MLLIGQINEGCDLITGFIYMKISRKERSAEDSQKGIWEMNSSWQWNWDQEKVFVLGFFFCYCFFFNMEELTSCWKEMSSKEQHKI